MGSIKPPNGIVCSLQKKITDPQNLALNFGETWWLICCITAPWAFLLCTTVTVTNFAVGKMSYNIIRNSCKSETDGC